jgi:hypothetical protein
MIVGLVLAIYYSGQPKIVKDNILREEILSYPEYESQIHKAIIPENPLLESPSK